MHTESELIYCAVVGKDKVSVRPKSEANQIDTRNNTGHRSRRSNVYDTTFALMIRHNIEILRHIKGDALRTSETTYKGLDLTSGRKTINLIRPRQSRDADVQPP